jgi:hypothetical protein
MHKWLQNDEDSPSDLEVWDSMKPTLENLQTILEEARSGKRKDSKKEKGKGSKWKGKEGKKKRVLTRKEKVEHCKLLKLRYLFYILNI